MTQKKKKTHQISKPEKPGLAEDDFFKKITFTWVGKGVLLRLYSQGKCSCCWACAGTGAITAIDSLIRERKVIGLSKQQLADCLFIHYPNPSREAKLVKLGKKACFPSRSQMTYQFAMEHGIVEETKYPYKMERNKCKPPPPDARIVKIDNFDLDEISMEDIEQRVRKQPITCTMRVYKSFHLHTGKKTYMGPTDEEIKDQTKKGKKATAHAMLIVGFGKDKNGEQFYQIQNTWGKKWGYKGFANIKRNLVYNLSYPCINHSNDTTSSPGTSGKDKGMDAKNEIPVSTKEPSTLPTVVNDIGAIKLPPATPTDILPPVVPPLPVCPPVLRPPAAQHGQVQVSDSDSDLEGILSGRGAAVSTQECDISKENRLIRERQEKAMQELLMKKRAAALAVPRNDMAVRAQLRQLGEPITLFGEREMERRDRLRMLMARLDAEGQLEKLMKAHEDEKAIHESSCDASI